MSRMLQAHQWQLTFFAAGAVALAPAHPTSAQANAPVPALAGLTAVRVAVDIKAPATVLSRTDTTALGNRIAQELQQYGWRVLPTDAPGAPLLFVGLLVAESHALGTPVYGIRLECTLTESVRRARDNALLPASTWSSGGQMLLVTNPAELSAAIQNGAVAVVAKFNRERGKM